jgi:hypothetical protein
MEPSDTLRRPTSREQVSRIDRGYYTRKSPMRSWRTWLTAAGLLAAVGWCAWGAIDPQRHHSPGAVAAVHAKWERDCEACHVPLSPIKDDTWLSTEATRTAMDAKCEACHRAAAHHPLQLASEVGSCASCHADHRGREADLARVADRTCTSCHADIASHRLASAAATPSAVTTPITRFDDEHHPAFASLAKDPGRLKFSHGRHMTAGLTFGGPSKSPPMTYAMLAEADRGRFLPNGAAEGDLVQLSCGSCHEFATSLPPDDVRQMTALLTASKPGAYSLPVSYGRHCAACHALPYEPEVPDRVMPHGLDAEGMRRFLVTAALEGAASGRAALDAAVPPRPLPANSPRPIPAVETLRGEIRATLDASRTFTRGVCGKCHDVEDATIPVAGLLEGGGENRSETWFRVPPTGVPDVWLVKARFSHVPHRGFDCRDCHSAAYPAATVGTVSTGVTVEASAADMPGSPLDNDRVMIAGRESCTACHAPAGFDAHGKPVGGVRFDCVECHGYHGLGPHHSAAEHAIRDATGPRR